MISHIFMFALASPPILLDAGTLVSPVLPGFSRLEMAQCEDSRVTWERSPDWAAWDRRLDPLMEDRLGGGLLHLDVEPGTWFARFQVGEVLGMERPLWFPGSSHRLVADGLVVWQMDVPSGDSYVASRFAASNPSPVFLPGQTEWDRQTPYTFPWRNAIIKVQPGGVSLSFGATPLMGLIMARTQAEADVQQALADMHRRDAYHAANPRSQAVYAPPSRKGAIAVLPGGFNDVPIEDSRRPEITVRLAHTERFAEVLWVYGDDRQLSWTLEGAPELGIHGFEIRWLDQTDYGSMIRRPRPTWLDPSTGELRGGQNTPVGLALIGEVPKDCTKTELYGNIVVRGGDTTIRVPIRVAVRDLELDPPRTEFGFWFDIRAMASFAYGTQSEETWAWIRRDLDLMRSLGLRSVAVRMATPYPAPGYRPARFSATGPVDTSLFERVASYWRGAGGTRIVWTDALFAMDMTPDQTGLSQRSQEILTAMGAAAKRHDATLYVYDEGAGKNVRAIHAWQPIVQELKTLAPSVPLLGCFPHPVDWPHVGPVDQVCMHTAPKFSRDRFQQVQDRGQEAVLYNPPSPRAGAGLLTWGSGVDMILQWGWDTEYGDIYNQVRGPLGFWNFTFPGPHGEVYRTTQLESFAEGMTDHRYLVTLERLISEAQATGSPQQAARTARGQAILDAARGVIEEQPIIGGPDGTMWSDSHLDTLRDAVANEAEYLVREKRVPQR